MYILLKYPILAWLLTFTVSCDKAELADQKVPPAMIEDTIKVNYLALGDSYTIGESVNTNESYPILLTKKLQAEGIVWAMLPDGNESTKIIAKTGWRTDQLQAAIANEVLLDKYDVVSLLIGVNNQFQGRDFEVYKTEFTELLNTAIELTGGEASKVFVLSIPDYAFTPYGNGTDNPQIISQEIDEYNTANKVISEAAGVSYFDITSISREGIDRPELVASDGLHPSGKMYAEWVELIWEAVKEKLK